jgi:hypothetical protein
VRLYLTKERAVVRNRNNPNADPGAESTEVASHELRPDPKYPGGGLITKDSIPAPYTQFGSITELLDATADASQKRVDAIHQVVSTHYGGPAPKREEMVELLREAIRERRLSNIALDR